MAQSELVRIRSGELDLLSRRREVRDAPTVADAIERFFAKTVPERKALGRFTERTAVEYRRYATNYVLPHLGQVRVRDVTRQHVEKVASSLIEAPIQRNRVLAFLSRLFNLIEDWEWRPQHSNPVRRIERASEPPRERALDEGELVALSRALRELEASHAVAVAAIRVASLTGLRIGEITSMRWEDVNFDTGRLFLPATKTGQRYHDLPAAVLQILESLPRINESVFTAGRAPLSYGWVRKVFVEAVRKAGLRDVRLHDLRRTTITMAAGTGLSAHVLRDFLGHRTTVMADRYIRQLGAPVKAARMEIGAQIAAVMVDGDGEDVKG